MKTLTDYFEYSSVFTLVFLGKNGLGSCTASLSILLIQQ